MWVDLECGEAGPHKRMGGDGRGCPCEQAPEGMRAVAASSIWSVISLKVVSTRLRHCSGFDRVIDDGVDVDEQVLGWQRGWPLREKGFGNHFVCRRGHLLINATRRHQPA